MFTSNVIVWLTNTVIGLIEFIIGLRVLLKFVGVGNAPFVQWVNNTSQPLLYPFQGMFPNTVVQGGNGERFLIEFSSLFALLIYAIIGYLINELIGFFARRRPVVYEDDDEEVVEAPARRRRTVRR